MQESRGFRALFSALISASGLRNGALMGFFMVFLFLLVFQTAASLAAKVPAAEKSAAPDAQADGGNPTSEEANPASEPATVDAPAAAPTDAPGGEPAAGEPAAADASPPADTAAPPDGASGGEEAEPPAGPIDSEKLCDDASVLIKDGKFDEAAGLLRGKDEELAASPRLFKCYLEALSGSTKPVWPPVERGIGELLKNNPDDPLGNYCMGRALSEKPKPNLTKALEHLAKAKQGRKPFKDSSTLYWKVWAKKNWALLAGAVAILLVVSTKVVQNRKAAKAAKIEAELQALADAGAGSTGETTGSPAAEKPTDRAPGKPDTAGKMAQELKSKVAEARKPEEPKLQAAEAPTSLKLPPRPAPVTDAPHSKAAENQPAEGKKTAKPKPDTAKPPLKPAPKEAAMKASPEKTPAEASDAATAQDAHEKKATTTRKQVDPGAVLRVAPGAVLRVDPGAVLRVAPGGPPLEEMDLATAAQVRETLEAPARPAIPANANVGGAWDRLCRKALAQPIPLDFQATPSGSLPGARSSQPGGWASPGESTGGLGSGSPGSAELAFLGDNLEVSIDLTAEGLKEDLLGKLKMLAITDGELRQLLMQRNPDHIPNLVEYIMTRPDPVRLAFVAREMGNYHDPAITDVLASLVFQDDQRVVLGAIQGLQTNGGNAAILHLCPFVQSDVQAIAEGARNALASFGAKRILEAFYHLPANPDPRIRAAGVYVLARMRGEHVSRILADLLYDQSLPVRKEVMLAMAFQKDPAYLMLLRDFARKATSEDDKRMARKTIVYLQGFVSQAARSGQGPRAA